MKRKVSKLRLSPNEEARIIREEHERRRKLRIQQVREQQRFIALQIRREVELRRQQELQQLEKELRDDWERQQREKLDTLQKLYNESLQLVGQGHKSAKENEPDLAAIAQREEENHTKAEERYREALKELKSQRLKDLERRNQSINARRKALQAEKERSEKVASLPPPPPNPIQNISPKKPHVVKRSDVSAFAATHYHMPENAVDREADTDQPDAHKEAELEARRLQDLQREEKRRREEQLEKARLRGRQALRREQLVQDRERLLVELEHMQQTDLLRRRQQVSQMPPQIFQPLYKRQEAKDDFQRDMEFAFEDMYTGERRVKGDLVVRLTPEPLPAPSTGSQDQELDVTLDDIATTETEDAQRDAEREAGSTEQETSAEVEPCRPAPRRALKKLLDRIRGQRNQWTHQSSRVPAADSPTIITDEIPERDSSIETGSLAVGDKDKQTPVEICEPVLSSTAEALEAMKPSASADPLLPELLANRIQEFEEERQRREDELEKEKRQQVRLLEELEEQKVKLEQMLLEAQQERENLKAAVNQDAPGHDEDVTSLRSGSASELVPPPPPPGEDDQTQRIRQYQQRLLEQNRIHQRSVEVARQRLEEYQRALRIRHNMSNATSLPSAVKPPGLVHLPPLRPVSLHPPAPLHLPTPAPLHLPTPPPAPSHIQNIYIPGSGFSVVSKLLPDESVSSSSTSQTAGATAWLSSSMMERVRPSSVTREPPPAPYFIPRHVPLQPDPIRRLSPSLSDVPPFVPRHTAVNHGASSQGSREDDSERQRRELQDVQRRVEFQQRLQEEDVQRRVKLQQRLQEEDVQRRVQEQRIQEEERQRRELQDAQRRELQDAQRRELQDAQRRELQDAQRRELQDAQRRELQDVQRRVELQQRLQEEDVQRRMQEQRLQEEDVQRRELQDAQRRVELQQRLQEEDAQRRVELQQRLQEEDAQRRVELQQRLQEEDAQRRELQDAQRRELQDAQRRELQDAQRRELQDAQRRELQDAQRRELQDAQRRELQDAQRRELQDAQRRVQEQKETVELEERQRQEVELEQMRRQKETLQALIDTDAQPVAETEDVIVSEDVHQNRLRLLASLLRAIEESNGGTLSHLQDSQDEDDVPQQPPSNNDDAESRLFPSGFLHHLPRAAKPPVARVRFGFTDVMTDQHELSAIQEVETPGSTSQITGPEESATFPSRAANAESESSPSPPASLETSSDTSNRLVWREGRLMGTGTRPESSDSDSVLKMISPLSSDSGRGADVSGAVVSSYMFPSESPLRRPESDCISSTSISTGSYITTDPELNPNTDKLPDLKHRAVEESGADLPDVSCTKENSAVESVFSDDSIQRIIDRYTRELDVSLSSAGKTTDSEGSYVDEVDSSVSLQSVVGVSGRTTTAEDENATDHHSAPSDTTGAQRRHLDWTDSVEDSFRPLIGQMMDQSSCLAAADRRDSSMEDLVGRPSAHSSMIDPRPGRPVSLSRPDPSGWDSTLSRMIGRLSLQSGSHWLSDFYAGQLTGPVASEPSTTWLEEEESGMRPLVGEMDESAAHHSVRSSADRRHVAFGVSDDVTLPSPEASAPPVTPQNQTGPMQLDPDRTEDSFHPLLAEVTHNETAEPSMIFTLPEHGGLDSPGGRGGLDSPGGHGVPTPPDLSPELVRTDERCRTTSPSLNQSFSQLVTSQCLPHASVLTADPTDVILSHLNVSDETPALEKISGRHEDSVRDLEAGGEKGIMEQSQITLVSLNTTLQDQDTVTQEDEEEEEASEETEENESQTHPATAVLEFQWSPSSRVQRDVFQQRRRALLQRSNRRVEEIKAKGAETRREARETSSKTKSAETRTKGGRSEKKVQFPPAVSESRNVKSVDEVKICTEEQRRRHVSEMHQRTQRLYERLEEVKQQKEVRSRQEDYAKNRLKAKEFHKKTLEKLRAKQTQR
ncbi:centrosomal protein of 295 kDa isoform X3 [Mugil cephalus]|uniref:centrosomal protein of 295 kDa isoform X3 n=1 Tax=Mugil cephalus TaxID=48193 RepID=UPI001FB76143|nr:centrosomal protein of 295 kDa isoform X3 [Mugil cephalus]